MKPQNFKIILILLTLFTFAFCNQETKANSKLEFPADKVVKIVSNNSISQPIYFKGISDNTVTYTKTFASATDVDTSSSTRSYGYNVGDVGGWFSADYPRVAIYWAVSDSQKVKIIIDYRAGASTPYLTYDAAGDTLSTIGTTSTSKSASIVLRAYGTDNIPGGNYFRVRTQSITGSEYDDPVQIWVVRTQ